MPPATSRRRSGCVVTPRTPATRLPCAIARLGEPQGYEDYLLYTLQFDPKMPEANYDYGMLLLSKKDIAGAAEHFRTSADAAPGVDKPQDRAGQARQLRGPARRSEAAQAHVTPPKRWLRRASRSRWIRSRLTRSRSSANCMRLRSCSSRPRSSYRKLLVLDPGNAIATEGLKRVSNGS